ncbi:rod shape-determining protein MreC [Candidatus Uabimicrobium sp. HlEnr_7]|uniref:rod shape-determining protein MreC n=1 Tax=Candidatus Uabimicrobium helgolandensis TaxID=3095367 RepID=UPI00355768F1
MKYYQHILLVCLALLSCAFMLYSRYFSSLSLSSFTFLLSSPQISDEKVNKDENVTLLKQQLASKQLEIIHLKQTLKNIQILQKEISLQNTQKSINAKILLRRDSSDHRSSFIINKGKKDGVALKSYVTFKKNLLGIVYKLSTHSSMVLRVSDPYMRIPIFLMIKENDIFTIYDEGICVGQSRQKCKIKFLQWHPEKVLPQTAIVLTSGFGNYPQGLIVGNAIIKKSEEKHYLLDVEPISLSGIYNVLVVVNQDLHK